MSERQADRPPTLRAAGDFVLVGSDERRPGPIGKAERAGRRVGGVLLRPQREIDDILVRAVIEVNDEAYWRVERHRSEIEARLAQTVERFERLQLEVGRLESEIEDRDRRLSARLDAIESALALVSERLADDVDAPARSSKAE